MNNTNSLFSADWMEKFNLFDVRINSFCKKCFSDDAGKLKKETKK